MKQHKEFWWGLGAFVLFITVFFVLGTIGWPGNPDPCTHPDPGSGRPDICFCERYDLTQPKLIQQPANTWSNLGYVVVGLLILWQIGTDRARAVTARNPMEGASFYAIGYGAIVLFLGPASMLFHATLTDWGGWIDVVSLILYGSFLLLYDLVRCLRWNTIVFGTIYLALTVVLAILHTISGGGAIGIVMFSILVVTFLILDIAAILWLKVGGVRRKMWPWWWTALISFGIAFLVFWLWSNTGGPLCNLAGRDSLLQGHAFWQLFSAVTTGTLFLYFRTETRL